MSFLRVQRLSCRSPCSLALASLGCCTSWFAPPPDWNPSAATVLWLIAESLAPRFPPCGFFLVRPSVFAFPMSRSALEVCPPQRFSRLAACLGLSRGRRSWGSRGFVGLLLGLPRLRLTPPLTLFPSKFISRRSCTASPLPFPSCISRSSSGQSELGFPSSLPVPGTTRAGRLRCRFWLIAVFSLVAQVPASGRSLRWTLR
jgi:hypothetical protein